MNVGHNNILSCIDNIKNIIKRSKSLNNIDDNYKSDPIPINKLNKSKSVNDIKNMYEQLIQDNEEEKIIIDSKFEISDIDLNDELDDFIDEDIKPFNFDMEMNINSNTNTFTKKNKEEVEYNYYYDLYTKNNKFIIISNTNFLNTFFCFYCKTYQFIPIHEIENFLQIHLENNKKKKFLIMAYRIIPEIFHNYDLSNNKILQNILQNNTGNIISIEQYKLLDKRNNVYKIDKTFRFENQFYQEGLTLSDYINCDICKKYLCPHHAYISNTFFDVCKYCNVKNWTICGWCKYLFNEYWACKILHVNKLDIQDNDSIDNFI